MSILLNSRWMVWLGVVWICSMPVVAQSQPPIPVVVSFTVLADLVQQVGGEAVTVTSLVGPNEDAHVYEPTPKDAMALRDAALFVINGLGFEGWIERLVTASSFKGAVVVASAGIRPLALVRRAEDGHAGEGHAGEESDPHAWHDLTNVLVYVTNIADGLTQLAPERAALFQANANRYRQSLTELDRWIASSLATIPPERRTVVSTHDAFGYFSRAYGVTFLSPVGVSTDAEPSAGHVANLIRQIRRDKISAIFLENRSNTRMAQQLIKESGAVLGGTLYTDALSTVDGPASSFLDLVRHNVTVLKKAMAGI